MKKALEACLHVSPEAKVCPETLLRQCLSFASLPPSFLGRLLVCLVYLLDVLVLRACFFAWVLACLLASLLGCVLACFFAWVLAGLLAYFFACLLAGLLASLFA